MDLYHPLTLPSQGKTYNGIDIGSVLIRPYCGEDEVFLSQISPVGLEKNYLAVLKRIVQGIDPKLLTTGDRLYIILWEYINSYSDTMTVETICSHCLQKVKFVVDLKTVNVVGLPDDFKQPVSVVLPVSKKSVQLRLLTVGDEIEVENYSSHHNDASLYRYARSVVGPEDPIAQLMEMRSWPAKDVARVRLFHEQMEHGPDMKAKVICSNPQCMEEEEVVVPFRLELFYPTGETLKSCFGA